MGVIQAGRNLIKGKIDRSRLVIATQNYLRSEVVFSCLEMIIEMRSQTSTSESTRNQLPNLSNPSLCKIKQL